MKFVTSDNRGLFLKLFKHLISIVLNIQLPFQYFLYWMWPCMLILYISLYIYREHVLVHIYPIHFILYLLRACTFSYSSYKFHLIFTANMYLFMSILYIFILFFPVLLKQGECNNDHHVPKLFEQKKDPLEDSGTFLPPILWRYPLDAPLRSYLLRAARVADKKKQRLMIRYKGYSLVSPVGWRQSTCPRSIYRRSICNLDWFRLSIPKDL